MIKRSVYVKAVAFLAVSAVLLGYLVMLLGDIRFQDSRDYNAIFTDVSQLKSGDPVRIAGVQVGKVSDVAIYRGQEIKVQFDVDSAIDLDRATRAVVRYKNLVGDRFLELQQGTTQRGPLGANGTIPTSQTKAALDLDDLFESFKPLLVGLDAKQINNVSTELVNVLQGQAGSVYRLLGVIGSLTNRLADNDTLIGDTLNNLSVALENIDNHRDSLSDAFVQVQQLVTGLARDRKSILSSADRIQAVAGNAAALLSQVRPSLKVDVDQLAVLARTLNRNSDTIRYVLNQAPKVHQTLARVGSHGAQFNFYLCALTIKTGTAQNPIFLPTTYSNSPRCKP